MDTLLDREIKGYKIRERVGVGGFGAVYRAMQSTIGREVAIKVILPQFANQPDFVRRFEVEAQVVARLEHPHIVPLYDYWRDPEGAYLVMRWLRSNLRVSLERSSWTLEAAARLLEQIAPALAVAHREGIVHRDIKPDNILLDEDENAYLADFGIAKDVHLRSPSSNADDEIAGSPAYLSPEQIRSDEVTERTDLYSLGYVLYELLTGEKPFRDAKTPSDYIMKHLSDPMPMLSIQHTHIPAAVDEVLQTATAKDPSQRYVNALRFAAAFRAALPQRLARVSAQPLADPLTERELEVLRLMIDGLNNQEIAERLFLTPGTVKWYVKQVYSKLDAHNRQQAVERALNLKLYEPRSSLVKIDPVLLDQPTVQGIEPLPRVIDPESPYKGLRAFQEGDAADFFGRATLTEQLLSRLSEGGDGVRFLTIVGPSGGGKSSVVRAGLIPALRKGALPVSPRPFVADFMPGTHPLEELEAALLRVAVNPMPGLLEQLRSDRRGLVRAAKRLLPNDHDTELILVVDQFEEVFTLVTDEALRVHFIDNLLAAASDPRGRVRIIVTLRADFYDRPLMYPRLAEIVRVNTEVIIPLSAREMEQAITAPLQRVGMNAENGLTATILHDIGEQPGTLPLLQYTLTELFERREGLTLTLDAYKAMGGVLGALARRAEDIYSRFDAPSQQLTRQLFLRMVTLGEGAEDTRRRVLQSEFATLSDETTVEDVLNAFVEYRLLTLDRDQLTHGPTVEIAHEALIREWTRLREWLNESREEIRLQRQLLALATDWQASQQETSFLLRGTRLEIFEKWAQETQLTLTKKEHDFLEASLTQRTKEQLDEEQRQARELKLAQVTIKAQKSAANRLRYLVAVMSFAIVGALILSGITINQSNLTQQALATSDANFRQSETQRIAAAALNAVRENITGEVPALLAIRSLQSRYSIQAENALLSAINLGFEPEIIAEYPEPVVDITVSPDGQTLAIAHTYTSNGGSVARVNLLSMETGEQIGVIPPEPSYTQVLFSPDGTLLLTNQRNDDAGVRLWAVQTGSPLHRYWRRNLYETIHGIAFSPDGRYILTGTHSEHFNTNDVILWDSETEREIRIFSGHTAAVYSVAMSPDGQFVLSGSGDTTVRLWETATGQQLRSFAGHTDSVNSVAFSPDGRFVLTASVDTTARLWETATGTEIHRFTAHTANVTEAIFSPDGRYILTGSEDRRVLLWNTSSGEQVQEFHGSDSGIVAVAFSPDGQLVLAGNDTSVLVWQNLVNAEPFIYSGHNDGVRSVAVANDGQMILSGSADHTARLWNAQTGDIVQTFVGHTESINTVALSNDGLFAATGSDDLTVRLWDTSSGVEIRQFNVPTIAATSVAFSPDGNHILIGNSDGTARLWDVNTGEQVLRYSFHMESVLNVAFNADGSQLLTASSDHSAVLWDTQSRQRLHQFTGHSEVVLSVAFSPDGRYILTGSADDTVRLWDAETGAEIRQFLGHSGDVMTVAFSPDGHFLLTGSADMTVRLWDATTGQELRRLTGHNGAVNSAGFTLDGRFIVTGSSDRTIRLWRRDLNDVINYACTHLPRDLTPEERAIYNITDDMPTCSPFVATDIIPTWTPFPTNPILLWTPLPTLPSSPPTTEVTSTP